MRDDRLPDCCTRAVPITTFRIPPAPCSWGSLSDGQELCWRTSVVQSMSLSSWLSPSLIKLGHDNSRRKRCYGRWRKSPKRKLRLKGKVVVSGEKWRGLSGKSKWRPPFSVLPRSFLFFSGELSGTWLMVGGRPKRWVVTCADRQPFGYLGGDKLDRNVGNFRGTRRTLPPKASAKCSLILQRWVPGKPPMLLFSSGCEGTGTKSLKR